MYISCPHLAKEPGVAHGFFTRNGGVSSGLLSSLNCAYNTGDTLENVEENMRRIAAALGVSSLARAYQVHSAKVIVANSAWARERAPEADAIVTTTPNLAIGITTADCLPILFADSKARVIGAAHAGWKGAIAGVIESTLEQMLALGANISTITATIGPSIAQGSYEVGSEFHAQFLAQATENGIYFIQGRREGHYLFDLKSYAKDRLRDAGITAINLLAHDTCFEENDFFSYRRSCLRGEPTFGCQLSAIALKE